MGMFGYLTAFQEMMDQVKLSFIIPLLDMLINKLCCQVIINTSKD